MQDLKLPQGRQRDGVNALQEAQERKRHRDEAPAEVMESETGGRQR